MKKTIAFMMALILCVMVSVASGATATKSTTAPTANIIESLENTENTGGVAASTLTNSSNRTVGQSFTHDQSYTLEAFTVKASLQTPSTSYADGTDVIDIRITEDTNSDGATDAELASETADVQGITINDLEYVTFTLSTPLSLTADKNYGVELWWTTDEADHSLRIERNKNAEEGGTDAYTGGQICSTNVYPIVFPCYPAGTAAAWVNQDLTFFVQGTEVLDVDDWIMFE